MDYRVAWTIMESVPIIMYLICYIIGNRINNIVALIFMSLFIGHYINRAYIYPWLTRGSHKIARDMVVSAIIVNMVNGYIQGRWLNYFGPILGVEWFISPQFMVGVIIFFVGLGINVHSDYILRNLRRPGETEYKIPRGGVFRWVSCGNYLGEVIEWFGWAILTWSFAGLVFAIWVVANLVPRALSHHKWYLERFPDYPKNRKAIFPFIL
ncbi:MAG: DUF1295 domain-containing protein [Candidatus Helarchaeota archaeon]